MRSTSALRRPASKKRAGEVAEEIGRPVVEQIADTNRGGLGTGGDADAGVLIGDGGSDARLSAASMAR